MLFTFTVTFLGIVRILFGQEFIKIHCKLQRNRSVYELFAHLRLILTAQPLENLIRCQYLSVGDDKIHRLQKLWPVCNGFALLGKECDCGLDAAHGDGCTKVGDLASIGALNAFNPVLYFRNAAFFYGIVSYT